MSNGEYRYVWRIVFRNFINSLRPRQIYGNIIAKDYLGNTYYEIPPNPSIGKRKAVRYYDPPKGNDCNDPLPPEWDAWLRQRRTEPPTEEEIAHNLAIMKLKQENGEKLEAKRIADGGSLPKKQEKGIETFPIYFEQKTGKYKM